MEENARIYVDCFFYGFYILEKDLKKYNLHTTHTKPDEIEIFDDITTCKNNKVVSRCQYLKPYYINFLEYYGIL